MLIGELARRAGVSRDTVRFYRRSGLIIAGSRPAGRSWYAEYSEEVLELLILIREAQSAGFSLREVKHFFDLYGSDIELIPLDKQRSIINMKLLEIENRMQHLKKIKDYLIEQLNVVG